jgi:hypothetical protein
MAKTDSKSATPENKALEQDILKEAAKAGGQVNQGAVKEQAQQLNQGEGSHNPPQGTQQAQATNTEPVTQKDTPYLKTDVDANAQKSAPQFGSQSGTFELEGYPDEPPATNEEMQAFLNETFVNWRRGRREKQQHETAVVKGQLPADDLHAERVKRFGEGYVIAQKKGANKTNDQQIFTAVAWQRLGGNDNPDGWRQIVEVPKEVKDLKK